MVPRRYGPGPCGCCCPSRPTTSTVDRLYADVDATAARRTALGAGQHGRDRRRRRPRSTGASGPLGGAPDRRVFPNIRAVADVILAAAGTVRAEGYGPPAPSAEPAGRAPGPGPERGPALAVVTSSLDLDPGWPLFTEAESAPLVVTTADAPAERRAALAAVADVLEAGTGRVDLADALGQIAALGAAVVVCEGGPSLNGQLLAAGLVDELCLTLAPLASAAASARSRTAPTPHPRAAAPAPARGGRRRSSSATSRA